MFQEDRGLSGRFIGEELATKAMLSALCLAGPALCPFANVATFELSFFAVCCTIIGIGHGAADVEIATGIGGNTRYRAGAVWLVYLLFSGLFALIALLNQDCALLLFLLVSLVHFSEIEIGPGSAVSRSRIPPLDSILARGVLPWLVAYGLHKTECMAVLTTYLLNSSLARLMPADSVVTVGLVLCLSTALIVSFRILSDNRASGLTKANRIFDLVAPICVFAAINPLFAFVFFFCCVHSPAHIWRIARSNTSATTALDALMWFYDKSMMNTQIALVFVFLAVSVGLNQSNGLGDHVMTTLIVVMAGLTIPHALVTALLVPAYEERRVSSSSA